MTSLKTSEKPFSESSKSCYESGRTDSGFLSGANLLSEENLSSEDLSGAIESSNEAGKNCPQLDSGVDIGLNVKFSGLAIDLKQGTKEQTGEAGGRESKAGVTNSATNEVKPGETGVTQPWELYFQQDEDGDTQLHIAIIQGFIEVVYSLIKMVPHPCFLDIPNDIVQSPLHLAVLTHQARIVRSLLVAGACVKARDRHGNTPLHLACQLGDLECVKALTEPISVSEMATANTFHSGHVNVPQDFEEGNYDGETCLHLAAYGGHTDVLRHLIWFGGNVNARENKSGRTILHFAVETLNYKLLRFLLDECPNGLTINAENYAGHTAYQLARVMDMKIARDLMSRGAYGNVDDIDDDEHPDHNAEEYDDEVEEMDNVHLETEFQCNRETLRV